uniref:Methyltransferase type 11 domain-containing protein n=1 Tax=Chromera velia CCMP2878 TaxID=1169474 RepID=A0A0G4FWS6_9ALVE|eukprot:Cvel_19137.t1-p1 / transcript=Cvel_19137.t1 / gene=Cvel_19137 / organism=Chromera_velia_CCMP2878 / gene_product=Ubiquinone/menaquinone biosynthesis, putative / transcript_product=Ubiquinone/menaquinone biosynthesis, putative / location=Cvel_scaffold1627:28387-29251(+) / protein_length=139 / sequence_SO=supercontig / SO=protein_coding / is_pseudo=false
MKWLDVAAGTGMVAEEFAKASIKFGASLALDQSTSMLKIAQDTNLYDFQVSHDISQKLPFLDNEFDLLTMIGASDYMDCRWGFLQEFARVVKPGGLMIFSVRDDDLPYHFWTDNVTEMIDGGFLEELEGPFRHTPRPFK